MSPEMQGVIVGGLIASVGGLIALAGATAGLFIKHWLDTRREVKAEERAEERTDERRIREFLIEPQRRAVKEKDIGRSERRFRVPSGGGGGGGGGDEENPAPYF